MSDWAGEREGEKESVEEGGQREYGGETARRDCKGEKIRKSKGVIKCESK